MKSAKQKVKLPSGVGMLNPGTLGAIPSKMMPNLVPPIRVKKVKKGQHYK
jgi:hypothetical protein